MMADLDLPALKALTKTYSWSEDELRQVAAALPALIARIEKLEASRDFCLDTDAANFRAEAAEAKAKALAARVDELEAKAGP